MNSESSFRHFFDWTGNNGTERGAQADIKFKFLKTEEQLEFNNDKNALYAALDDNIKGPKM